MRDEHKPLLLRGARQVGKSTAVRQLGMRFDSFVEVNFERNPNFKELFQQDLDVRRIVPQMEAIVGSSIVPGKTLLFFDEIQACPEAIMALRFFKEDMPQLHVVAAGSLLEFALDDLPTFGVGRIHSMYMHPMTFDEFLLANGEQLLLEARNRASVAEPLPGLLHQKLEHLLRVYMLVGGMPAVVAKWVETGNFLDCQVLQDDIIVSYEDDFPKYKKRVDSVLLRHVLRSVALQASHKFVYAQVGDYKGIDVKNALELLVRAGLVVPVQQTKANGVPLGGEANGSNRKMLLFDTGLMLRLLNMALGDISEPTNQILLGSAVDLVNKGSVAEMFAGLELLRYREPNLRYELFYWSREAKNSQAEVDYVVQHRARVLPVEVKARVQGGMKSLWLFMREKALLQAVRCSLENFGAMDYVDAEANNANRRVIICPLYALSQLNRLLMEA